jgi:hypothetical protein
LPAQQQQQVFALLRTGRIADLEACNRSSWRSMEIQQNDIASNLAACNQQLLSVCGPVEIKDSSGTEFCDLLWFATCHRLFPNVRRAILR